MVRKCEWEGSTRGGKIDWHVWGGGGGDWGCCGVGGGAVGLVGVMWGEKVDATKLNPCP